MTGTIVRSRKLRERRRVVRRERVRRWTRRAVAVLLIGGTVAGGVALASSSLFALDGVDVVGARVVPEARVREAAGLRPGENVLRLNLGAVERRIEAIDEIRDAQVRRAGALRVRITVVERTAAVVVRAGRTTRAFDLDGVEVRGPVRGRVPVVHLRAEQRVTGEGRILEVLPQPDARVVRDVLAVWASAGDLRASIERFDLDATGLATRIAGIRVTLGDVSDVKEKIAAVRVLMRWARDRQVRLRSVDVRVPDRPAMRLA